MGLDGMVMVVSSAGWEWIPKDADGGVWGGVENWRLQIGDWRLYTSSAS